MIRARLRWRQGKLQDRVVGIHSRRARASIKRAGFAPELEALFSVARSNLDSCFVPDSMLDTATTGASPFRDGAKRCAAWPPALLPIRVLAEDGGSSGHGLVKSSR